jgi:hypothetical protein
MALQVLLCHNSSLYRHSTLVPHLHFLNR